MNHAEYDEIVDALVESGDDESFKASVVIRDLVNKLSWHPIETAEDEIKILLYAPRHIPIIGYHSGMLNKWVIPHMPAGFKPTHWMRLPDCPQ